MEQKTPVPVTPSIHPKPIDPKMSKLKLAFLYVLIGGLVISALISVVAILIGQFNETVLKALMTTFIFVIHSLIVIAIVSADRNNRLGKDIISTTILLTVIANMFTTTLATWQILPYDTSWKTFQVYTLAIGSAFIVTAILKLRTLTHKLTNNLTYTTVGLIILLTVLFVPWILNPDFSWNNSFYFRLIGAMTILAATTFSVAVIFNRIAASQKHQSVKKKDLPPLTGGMVAIYICVGTIVGVFWLVGFSNLVSHAVFVNRGYRNYSHQYDYNNVDTQYR